MPPLIIGHMIELKFCKKLILISHLVFFMGCLLADPKKTEHLRALEGANERLHLLKANLLEEGSFDSVVEGCEGVFHTASPFYENVTDPQVHIIISVTK